MTSAEDQTTRVLPVSVAPTREHMVWDGTDAGAAPAPADTAAAAAGPSAASGTAAPDRAAAAAAAPPAGAAPATARPRIRWAAILWGTVLAVAAAATLGILLDPARRAGFALWIGHVSPGILAMYGVLVVGGIVLLIGLLGLIRAAERRRAAVEGAGS